MLLDVEVGTSTNQHASRFANGFDSHDFGKAFRDAEKVFRNKTFQHKPGNRVVVVFALQQLRVKVASLRLMETFVDVQVISPSNVLQLSL